MQAKYTRHPLSAAWPEMDEEELQKLQDSIKNYGQKLAILVTKDGQIVDGWNRYRACQNLLGDPWIQVLDDDENLEVLVDSLNDKRRHATDSQRTLWAVKRDAWMLAAPGRLATKDGGAVLEVASAAPGKGEPGSPLPARKTVEDVATELGVSDRTVQMAKVVVEKGGYELQQAVGAGDLTLKEAATIARLPKEEQPAALKRKVQERAEPKPRKKPEPKTPVKAVVKRDMAAAPAGAEDITDADLDIDLADELDRSQKELEQAQADIKAMQADDLKAEALKWRRMADVALRRQGELQENAALYSGKYEWYRRQLMAVGKIVGVNDPTKVVAAVEAMALAAASSMA